MRQNEAPFVTSEVEAPTYFYQRFDMTGKIIDPRWMRITSEASEKYFQVRQDGLKFLMINPPIREWSYPNIMPLGMGYVCSVAKMDGHHVDTLDLNGMRERPLKKHEAGIKFEQWIDTNIERKLTDNPPQVIGIGGIVTQYSRIKKITALCKKICPDVPIVLGGGIASCLPEFMLERLSIDVAVVKEAETTFSQLLECIENGYTLKGVAGVAFKDEKGNIINNGLRTSLPGKDFGLDYLPWPLRTVWPIEEIYKRNPVGHLNWKSKWVDGAPTEKLYSLSMIASRGCPYGSKACDYCYATYLGKTYRLRSPRDVVDEMEYLVKRYHVQYIHFLDDLLMADFRWGLELCEELRQRKRNTGFEVMWGGACRTNIIADDVLRAKKSGRPNLLEQAYEVGMRQAGYGVETASPTILKSIDKSGQSQEKIKIAIRETQRVLGYADCSFMIGSPGESQQTVQETVDVCRELGLKPEVFFFTTAYPATSFWDLALEKGLIAKAVTGEKGPADDNMIERYLLALGEQGETVRTNFSDLPDEEVVRLSWWAINELGAQNTKRHPQKHKNEAESAEKEFVRGASMADL